MAKQNSKTKVQVKKTSVNNSYKNKGLKSGFKISAPVLIGLLVLFALVGGYIGTRYFGGSKASIVWECRNDWVDEIPTAPGAAIVTSNLKNAGGAQDFMEEWAWMLAMGLPAGYGADAPNFYSVNAQLEYAAATRYLSPAEKAIMEQNWQSISGVMAKLRQFSIDGNNGVDIYDPSSDYAKFSKSGGLGSVWNFSTVTRLQLTKSLPASFKNDACNKAKSGNLKFPNIDWVVN